MGKWVISKCSIFKSNSKYFLTHNGEKFYPNWLTLIYLFEMNVFLEFPFKELFKQNIFKCVLPYELFETWISS